MIDFGELYEIGLAIQDKTHKKEKGQYYTPEDVALVMSKWLLKCDGMNICDVGCGTGKLILTYLDLLGKEAAKKIIEDGRIYLYDFDNVALKICKTSIILKYGLEYNNKIHAVCCDFLDKNIVLPDEAKVISNPPYASISKIEKNWVKTDVINDTKEYYSAFMEKIFEQAKSAVIITPFSFISGTKFYSLREKMCKLGNGFIISFDNVPGNIFYGKKHGIFNTNTSNSVRAAITVMKKSSEKKGYMLSPLIRFKKVEREKLLNCKVLENFLSNDYQIVDKNNQMFYKCDKKLINIYKKWINFSKGKKVKDYISNNGIYVISMSNTCRYYTSASNVKMKRRGQIILRTNDENTFYFLYCLINSSFAYWFWRLYDGGITYPKSLLLDMPVFIDSLSNKDIIFFKEMALEMISKADEFKTIKNNVGIQENIKYPRMYRDAINRHILNILGIDFKEDIFDIVHSNMALKINLSL